MTSLFSKRHYEAVAAKLAEHRHAYATLPTIPGSDSARAAVETLAEDVADLFAGDNPRFKRERFLKACGIQE